MIPDILPPGLSVLFAGIAATELSARLGFHHLDPRDRFWELLAIGGITPSRLISSAEAKALDEGNRSGNLTDPVRLLFIEKKTGQLLNMGIGLTSVNKRIAPPSEKDPAARPTEDDVRRFIATVGQITPKLLAFVMPPDVYMRTFSGLFPGVQDTLGLQAVRIAATETWFLGSTTSRPRGEGLTKQEDTFFALGERIEELKARAGS